LKRQSIKYCCCCSCCCCCCCCWWWWWWCWWWYYYYTEWRKRNRPAVSSTNVSVGLGLCTGN